MLIRRYAKIVLIKGNIARFTMWPFDQAQQIWGSLIATGIVIEVFATSYHNRFQLQILTECFNSSFLKGNIARFIMWPFDQEQQIWGSLIVTGIVIEVFATSYHQPVPASDFDRVL